MPVLLNTRAVVTCPREGAQDHIAPIADGAVAFRDGMVSWVGPRADLPSEFGGEQTIDAQGALVIPGLIDCHTHLAFGGWRAKEFAMRIRGTSYLEIAKAGGGIASTVAKTRAATETELLAKCRHFIDEMIELGVTSIECKSGYGLTAEDELKTLRVYRALAAESKVDIFPTFLGAHIVAPEYRDRRGEYVRLLVEEMIPAVAAESLARFCDVFVEETAFSADEARRILCCAAGHGMRAKLHVDQLSNGGGAELAAELGAISADHLEHISEAGIAALKRAGTVAVSLPIASLYTFQRPLDARKLIAARVPVAVSTDLNPGSAPSCHLPFAMTLACTLNRMTPAEVLKGVTTYAARAVNADSRLGSLAPGFQADMAVIDAPSIDQWLYHFTANACVMTIKRGTIIRANR